MAISNNINSIFSPNLPVLDSQTPPNQHSDDQKLKDTARSTEGVMNQHSALLALDKGSQGMSGSHSENEHSLIPTTLLSGLSLQWREFFNDLMGNLSATECNTLKSRIETLARADGVPIAAWDHHWAEHHLFDDAIRLIKGLIWQKKGIEITDEIRDSMCRFVDNLSPAECIAFHLKVRHLAVNDGVIIGEWDKEWSQYHLFDDVSRFIQASIDLKQGILFHDTSSANSDKDTIAPQGGNEEGSATSSSFEEPKLEHPDHSLENGIQQDLNILTTSSTTIENDPIHFIKGLLQQKKEITTEALRSLHEYINNMSPSDAVALQSKVYQLAKTDGVTIEEWDKDWSQHHLFDDIPRLIRAIDDLGRDALRTDPIHFMEGLLQQKKEITTEALRSLHEYINNMSPSDAVALQSKVYQLAKTDGVTIEEWDKDWSQHHLFDDIPRLIRAIDDLGRDALRTDPIHFMEGLLQQKKEITTEALRSLYEYINNMSPSEAVALQSKVYQLAKTDGVNIAYWDTGWGQHHLFDDIPRLIRAIDDLERDALRTDPIHFIKGLLQQKKEITTEALSSLHEYINNMNPSEAVVLQSKVYQLAKTDGVNIAYWDTGWGQHHLFDDIPRLIRAIDDLGRDARKFDFFSRDYDFFASLVNQHQLNQNGGLRDIKSRADLLFRLNNCKVQLCMKFHGLGMKFSKKKSAMSRAWQTIENFLLVFPVNLTEREIQHYDQFILTVNELIKGDYDEENATIILDKLMMKQSFRPSFLDIKRQKKILEIDQMTRGKINAQALSRADESAWKEIIVIPSNEDKQGKLKPLGKIAAVKEVFAAECDRALGFGMTAVTRLFGFNHFFQSLLESKKLFKDAAKLLRDADRSSQKTQEEVDSLKQQASFLRQQAFKFFESSKVPATVRDCIFGQMYDLRGNKQPIDDLGYQLFYSCESFSSTDAEKAASIQNYFDSDSFREHLRIFGRSGSLQIWKNGCQRAYELIAQDTDGGNKLKAAPKALVHLYALLGIIKGSQDCSSGNTLVEVDSVTQKVTNFLDFDDERSMPASHDVHLRLWQLGLPQCNQPFDRAVLDLFSDPSLLQKLKKQQSFESISPESYQHQTKRLKQIIDLFQLELSQEKITLTPRDLYFHLFGGREEFNQKLQTSNCTEYSSQISPLEIFEYHLAEIGKGFDRCSEDAKPIVQRNLSILHSAELS